MRPRISISQFSLRFAGMMLVMVCLGQCALAASGQTRIFIRENFPVARRDSLTSKLRKITGLGQLRFGVDGSLALGSDVGQKGSPIAQLLLSRAAYGSDLIVLEDASSRSDVAFCRVVAGTQVWSNSISINTHVVLIDFADFEKIIGDRAARESFDAGWGLMHELAHVVNDANDADLNDHLGECERHINEMRQEMGLPVRADYFYKPLTVKSDPNFRTRFVSLQFERPDVATGRLKTFLLTWDSSLVGGLSKTSETSFTASR